MSELQLKAPTMESVETVDVSWLHHSQKGELYTLRSTASIWMMERAFQSCYGF